MLSPTEPRIDPIAAGDRAAEASGCLKIGAGCLALFIHILWFVASGTLAGWSPWPPAPVQAAMATKKAISSIAFDKFSWPPAPAQSDMCTRRPTDEGEEVEVNSSH